MKGWVLSAALAVMLVPACAFGAIGSDAACEKQVHQKQVALQEAIRRHGEHSAQAGGGWRWSASKPAATITRKGRGARAFGT